MRFRHALLLLGLVVLAYWPVVHCGFVWDDDDYVTQNPVLRTAAGLLRIWLEPTSLPQYYPFVHTTFWLEYRLWGDDPLGYHLVNVALHLGSSLALLRLLRWLEVPGALLAAALFAVHPVHVESVAWITERKNLLSMFCMLLAAQQWLKWIDARRRRSWWLASAWFLAALLAKTVTATLPAGLLVVQWWRNGRIRRREVLGVLPWFVLALCFGLITAWLEATHVRAAAEWQLHGAERLLVAGRAPWFYLAELVWPVGLCFNYPRWQLDAGALLQWLPVAGTVAAPLLAILLRHRIGRGPAAVLLLFGGMLVPALGFFDVYPFRFSYVADHFQYHASAAMLAALAAVATLAARRRLSRPLAMSLVAVLLGTLAVLANLHVRSFRDLETSWRATLECNPRSMLALVNLGGLLLERGEIEAAKRRFEDCLRWYPDNYESLGNLGQIAHRRGELVQARSHYEESLAVRPDNASVLNNLALLDLQEGNTAAALSNAREAVALEPDMYEGRMTLARAAFAAGRWQECVEQADWMLMRTPDELDIRLLAARALLAAGNSEGALQNTAAVLAKEPTLESAQRIFARALAVHLRSQPVQGIAARVDRICRSGGLDPAPLIPRIAAELRELGNHARAAALQR